MIVKNNAPRLIVINAGGDEFKVIPGVNKTTKLSKEAANLAFTKRLLAKGDLVEVSQPAEEKPNTRTKKSEE